MKYYSYKIYIDKQYLYRVLNLSRNISIRNVVRGDQTASFEIDHTDRNTLYQLLEQENIPVHHEKQFGYFKFFKFNKLKLIILASIITVSMLYVNSRYIWKISVDGNYSHTSREIVGYVHKSKYKEGMNKSKVNCEWLETKIRADFNDISWVSCEIKGTNLLIHLKENYIAGISQKEKKPYSIVSNVSGEIMSIITRRGTAKVKAKDHVKKGTVLVSGKIKVSDESEQKLFTSYCNADADIMAKVVHNYSDTIDKEYRYVNPAHKKTYYLPSINQRYWNISRLNKKITEKSMIPVKLFDNYYLPFSINKIIVYTDKPVVKTISKEQANKQLEHKMLYFFMNLEQKGYKILEKDVKIKEMQNTYTLSGTYTCIEPIGKVKYINMKKEKAKRESETQ